ncbi:MAG: hypothetical protein KDD33_03455 [Bdellovibrionales bacterium]|nr:hypothetical protein [Bdellovibrionales bacterium]
MSRFLFTTYRDKAIAKRALIRLLQNAHAGEKAAANAYFGHGHSLFVRDKTEKQEIYKIYLEELHHRERLAEFLIKLGSKPRVLREIGMWFIGFFIGVFSFIGTWLIPMYGAGRLESTNIGEYEVAARLAWLAGEDEIIEELLLFAEVEWDHELYFREKTLTHPLGKHIPLWVKPASKEQIRSSFFAFKKEHS